MKKTEGSNTEREDWERKTSTHREIDGEREREKVKHTNTHTLTHTHIYIYVQYSIWRPSTFKLCRYDLTSKILMTTDTSY